MTAIRFMRAHGGNIPPKQFLESAKQANDNLV